MKTTPIHAFVAAIALAPTVLCQSTATAQVCDASGGSSVAINSGVHQLSFRATTTAGSTGMPVLGLLDFAYLGRLNVFTKQWAGICVHRASGADEFWYAYDVSTGLSFQNMPSDLYTSWFSQHNNVEVLATGAFAPATPVPYTCYTGRVLTGWSYSGYTLYQFGDGGYDRLYGGSGADRICGGTEPDELNGGAGSDTLDGWTHGDSLIGDVSGDTGNDILWGYTGGDYMGDGSATSSGDAYHGEAGSDCLVDLSSSWSSMSCGAHSDAAEWPGAGSLPGDCETRAVSGYCNAGFAETDSP